MRVLYVNSSRGWGGMEMHPLEVAGGLARHGCRVEFAVRSRSPMSVLSRDPSAVRRRALPFVWYLDPVTYTRLRALTRSVGPEVIHVHYSKDTWYALLLAGILRRRSRLVFTKHLASPDGMRKKDPLHKLLAKRIDAFVAISCYMKKNILSTYAVGEAKVPVIYYGVSERVVGTPDEGRKVRERLGVLPHQPLVGMVAQVTPDKRQDLFVEAAARLVAQSPSCAFVLAGESVQPAYAARVKTLISKVRLEGSVRWLGFVEDIPSLMQAIDVLVMPSKAEAFGLVLIEAMANGRPVVASNAGAVPELVSHGRNGYLFPEGDPEALADALFDLLNDPDKRHEMGREGKRMFLERFRLDREVTETLSLYESLLSRR
jgi:glycosyltransferase involved in cell wall biosynthesis